MLEQFIADGIPFMFGNPGTVEEGFLDVMSEYRDRIEYIFALQESIAVAAADGYARATQKIGLIQLHSVVGLGNGIGNLYQAFRGHSPLLVIAGEAGTQYAAMDAQMAADLVQVARPVTKYATRVTHPTSVLRTLRRAIRLALTPPAGPVFVALPMDVLDAENHEEVRPTQRLNTATSPNSDVIQQIAELLRGASRPLVVVGDGVAYSGGSREVTRIAALIGAEVWGANSAEINVDPTCPLYRGQLGHMFAADSEKRTRDADVVLVCGTYLFPEVFPELDEEKVFAPTAQIVHIDLDPYEIGKNFRISVGVVSDPKETLAQVADRLASIQSAQDVREARQRTDTIRALTESSIPRIAADADRIASLESFAAALAKRLPADFMIFDEALTHSPELARGLVSREPGSYFQTRGGSLGVGIPGAIGMKLASPDRTVVGFSGDGGSLYTIQALWTAAHHKIDVKFVICNNRSYRILKWNIEEYWRERGEEAHAFPPSFDISDPNVRFAELAKSLGVEAETVEFPEQIETAIERALNHPGPYLIDLIISD
jgi:benzoylformate decarboxylase